MKIKWIAHSCFAITLDDGTGMVFDPFGDIGYDFPDLQADIVFISHSHYDHSAADKVKGDFKVFNKLGTFCAGNIGIEGIASYHDTEMGKRRGQNIIFKVSAEGLTLAHLGDIGHIPGEGIIEKLKGIDVLFVPVGGIYTINADEAFEVCKLIEPTIILPMHYKTPGLNVNIGPLHNFMEAVQNYYDRSFQGKSEFSYSSENRKKRPRIVLLETSV